MPAKMSYIPRGTVYHQAADPSFTPLFRLLDEFDTYSREAHQGSGGERPRQRGGRPANTANYTPKFDGCETTDAYELHGEFPGIKRDKIDIEFTDSQTLVIRGRVDHSDASGTTPSAAGLVEGGGQQSGGSAITERGEEHAAAAAAQESNTNGGGDTSGQAKNKASNPVRYWIQERTVGEFARTFCFPGPVDLNAVSARLHDGVLSLVIPKTKKREAHRIAIN